MLAELGDERAVEPLLGGLLQPILDCEEIAKALAKLGEPQWEPLCARSAKETFADHVRRLASSRDVRLVKPLIAVLQFPSEEDRESAVDALAEIGGASTIEPLVGALEDVKLSVRLGAARALISVAGQDPSLLCSRKWDAVRQHVQNPHRDTHEDRKLSPHPSGDCHGDHADNHSDRGIGLSFPEGPPASQGNGVPRDF